MAEIAKENQNDVYVRKDVFDARMDRMEMLLEKTTVEIKSYVDKAVGELKAEIIHNRNDIQVLNARVNSLENTLFWWIGVFGLIAAFAVFIPPIIGFFKKIFQPSVTIEEIQRLIDTAITTRLSGGESK
ncbi:MAG: hypothetical protein IJR27_05200 [Synergistaceae bacterium]|nr:hypothetical protein [Synergistaceae bacterium]MBQ9574656.1 hypothetical protein [Synergistaceae bacterium]